MNKNIYAIAVILLSVIFVSCDDSDDDIDYEWKKMNEEAFDAFRGLDDYLQLTSQSKNGYIWWKESNVLLDDELTPVDSENSRTISLRITPEGKPEYTDSVTVRYEGWFFDKDGKKFIFDTTEDNRTPREFSVKGVMDGWTTALQAMDEGEEREVIIPWILGYGSYGQGKIPGYTTLYFNIRLIKIHQMAGRTN